MNIHPIVNTLSKYRTLKARTKRRVIFGMGNHVYPKSRESIGWVVVDALAQHLGFTWHNVPKVMADIAEDGTLILVKPKTFLTTDNGLSLYRTLRTFATSPDRVTVVYAEAMNPIATMHVTFGGRTSHNSGLESLYQRLRTEKFGRLGIGVCGNVNDLQSSLIPSMNLVNQTTLERCRLLNPFSVEEQILMEDPTFKSLLFEELLSEK